MATCTRQASVKVEEGEISDPLSELSTRQASVKVEEMEMSDPLSELVASSLPALPGALLSSTAIKSPSPELFVDYAESTQSSPLSYNQSYTSFLLNYGSEEEEEDENDEEMLVPVIVSRSARSLLEAEVDEESEPLQKQHLDWSLPFAVAPTQPRNSSPPTVLSFLGRDYSTDIGIHQPSDLFEFQWQAFSDSVSPNLRREAFADIKPGPRYHYQDPYAAFTAIWDRRIMAHICKQTNLYVQQMTDHLRATGKLYPMSRVTKWKDINIDELYVYFAIILAMGVVVKSRIEEYWSTRQDIFITSGFSAYMSVNRFLLISRWLHFNNNQVMRNVKLSRAEAKLFKVKPITDHLNHKFSTLYTLNQNIALDEFLTQRKGLSDIHQFTSNKAAAVAVKSFEICECHTGYLWRFETHADFEPSQISDPVSEAIPSIVLRLIQGLEFKGHTLWMGSDYTSPTLARTLKSMQLDCAGTLRTNRQFVPVQLATLQMVKGQIIGCTSGDVDLLIWRGENRVALISTYHGPATTRCGETLKPTLLYDYNLCMGGIDKRDKMLAMYPIERKETKVWYKKLFKRFLNVSVFNSYIMYKFNVATASHRDFRLDLVRQLLAHHHKKRLATLMATYVQGRPKFSEEVLNHLPSELGLLSGGKWKIRRVCVVCKERTHTYCPGCNVALCTYKRHSASSTFSCFRKHHS